MDIASILEIENIEDYILHAARRNSDHVEPLDTFISNRGSWDSWNSYRGGRNEFNRDYVVSFIKFYPEQNTWLFGGIYKILERGPEKYEHSYKIELTDKGKDLIGRLKVTAGIPRRGRAFIFKKYYDEFKVCEVLREPYNGETFNGYENISKDFSMLEVLYNNERTDWKTALENVKGIYVIADKKTGRKYVGSAYGAMGIWSRWRNYIENGHGWNKELVGLTKDVGIEYAREHFRFTLIECWPFKTDDSKIIQRESFWKEALLTRGKHGYNSN